jgi:undecaprenyl-diphosphatase
LAALSLALCALALFAWLGLEVYRGETLRFDDLVRTSLHQHVSPLLTEIMRAFTFIGGPIALCVLVATAILAFWMAGLRHEARMMTIALGGALVLEIGLKDLFHRARPQPYFNTPLPSSFSFPSGHALYSMCLFGMLAALVAPRARTRAAKIAIWTGCSLMIGMIGLSRIYLGVHYPSDVLAGYASALVWVLALRAAMDWAIRRRKFKDSDRSTP